MNGHRNLVSWVCYGPVLIYRVVIDWALGGDVIAVGLKMGLVEAGMGFSKFGDSSS